MEIQVIFKPVSKGDFDKSAVLSFLVKERAGFSNKFFEKIDLLKLPNMNEKRMKFNPVNDQKTISIEDFFLVEDDDEFGGFFSYLYYEGSITSPPCDGSYIFQI